MEKRKKQKIMCITIIILILFVCSLAFFCVNNLVNKNFDFYIDDLSCQINYQHDRNVPNVLFGWKIKGENKTEQSAYRIVLAESINKLENGDFCWDTKKIESNQSMYIEYDGESLQPNSEYYYRVEIWNEDNKFVKSDTESFFISPSQDSWTNAKWISVPEQDSSENEINGFTVSFDFQTQNSSAFFVFGSEEGQYGKYYRWEINATGEHLKYTFSKVNNGKLLDQEEIETEYLSEMSNESSMSARIVVQDDKITTYLNAQKVAESQLDSMHLGDYGFCTTRSTDITYYDNVEICDLNGNILAQDDFEDPEHTLFTPQVLDYSNGRLALKRAFAFVDKETHPAPMIRKSFDVAKEIESAFLYGAALGIYESYLNGERLEGYYHSGRQDYLEEIQYDSFDITEQVMQGNNAFAIYLGHGWFDRANYRGEGPLGFKGLLVLQYKDGTTECIPTDDSWKYYVDGPILEDDMFCGEIYDARKEIDNWTTSDFDDTGWKQVECNQVAEKYLDLSLTAKQLEKIDCMREIHPISVQEPVKGVYVYDFGQEFSGYAALHGIQGQEGQCVTIQMAEALNTDSLLNKDDVTGTVWTDNYYMAQNTNYFYLGNQSSYDYEPHLVCTAFRYVQITGLSEALPPDNVIGKVLATGMEQTSTFECSNPKVNKLYENIKWTQLSNYMEVPTDCPQRDERLGWTGDAQTFARSAAYNMNTYQFMNQYLYYLRNAQYEDGAYPEIAPYFPGGRGHNGWSDAGIIITWYQYLQYGDKQVIIDNYDSMKRYMNYLVDTSENYIRTDELGYGDHNSIAVTPKEITSTALCAYVASLMEKMASVLELTQDEKKFRITAQNYKEAWQKQFVAENGSIECWTQAAYTLGLAFDLFGNKTEDAKRHLSTCVSVAEGHLNTGYIATQFLLPVLVDSGNKEQAFAILEQETYPSWIYLINQGATTLHERWNSIQEKENGYEIQGSLNHYGLGTVNEFLFRYVLGIDVDENMPGFKHIILHPTIGGTLTYAKGSYESIYGKIVSEWEKTETGVTYHFVIPANTTASLYLEGEYQKELPSGEHTITIENE